MNKNIILKLNNKVALQEDETFHTIQEIDEWDAYFEEKKEKLEEHYESLLEEYDRRFGTMAAT